VNVTLLGGEAFGVNFDESGVERLSWRLSPSEEHNRNDMQMNGYENPTYRYFEMSN
jgi:hypothetical protein